MGRRYSSLFPAPNLTVVCIKSGSCQLNLLKVIRPKVSRPVLMIDKRSGQISEDRYLPFDNEDVPMKVKGVDGVPWILGQISPNFHRIYLPATKVVHDSLLYLFN